MTAHRSLILAVFLTLGPFVGRPVAADPVLDFTGGSEVGAAVDATFGWKFTVASPITIGGLGVFDVGKDGLANSHMIGLWTSGGISLTSTTIPAGNGTSFASASTAGNWQSTPITPLALLPGDYVVGAFYATNDADHLIVGGPPPSTIPGVTWDESRVVRGSSLQFP